MDERKFCWLFKLTNWQLSFLKQQYKVTWNNRFSLIFKLELPKMNRI